MSIQDPPVSDGIFAGEPAATGSTRYAIVSSVQRKRAIAVQRFCGFQAPTFGTTRRLDTADAARFSAPTRQLIRSNAFRARGARFAVAELLRKRDLNLKNHRISEK